jgi:shikimate 5-dehydrogenase
LGLAKDNVYVNNVLMQNVWRGNNGDYWGSLEDFVKAIKANSAISQQPK